MAKINSCLASGGGSQFQAELLTTVPSKITTPFKPKKISICARFNGNAMAFYYDEDIDSTKSYRYYSSGKDTYNIPWASPNAACISKVEDDGFEVAYNGDYTELYYVAVG